MIKGTDLVIYKKGETHLKNTVKDGKITRSKPGQVPVVMETLTVEEYLKILGPEYEAITLDEACTHIREEEDRAYIGNWIEITESQWWEYLEVLPPEKWQTVNGVEIFRMCEYWTGDITCHYAQLNNRYFSAHRRTSVKYEDIAKEIKDIMVKISGLANLSLASLQDVCIDNDIDFDCNLGLEDLKIHIDNKIIQDKLRIEPLTLEDNKTLILNNIDLALLEDQRVVLNDMFSRISKQLTTPENEALTGVLNMLDDWSDTK